MEQSSRNMSNLATQIMSIINDIKLMNCVSSGIILSQVLSPGNKNLNINNSSILSSSNQLAHRNVLSCVHDNKVTELLSRLRQLELFVIIWIVCQQHCKYTIISITQ